MPRTTFVDRSAPAVSAAWFNAADEAVVDHVPALQASVADLPGLAADEGAGMVGWSPTAAYGATTLGRFLSALLGRTAAEIAAAVTPTDYRYLPGNILRYGAVGDDATDCTAAITAAIAQWEEDGSPVEIPAGIFRISAGFSVTQRLVMRGQGKYISWIKAIGMASDSSMFTMTGTAIVPINGWEVSGINFSSNNASTGPRAWTMDYCINGVMTDCYFYEVARGWVGDYSYLNNFRSVAIYGVHRESWYLQNECNNNTWHSCGIRSISSHGFEVTGNTANITLLGCNIEGIVATTKAGIHLAPATGKRVVGVMIQSYFERISGLAIETAGADANSVTSLNVTASQIYGGIVSLSLGAGTAQYAVKLRNVDGFTFVANDFIDWELAGFDLSATAINGEIRLNRSNLHPVAALTAGTVADSVDIVNNFKGRRVESAATMPSTGAYTVGDFVRNTTPALDGSSMAIRGWLRLVTGSAHVSGTDWAVERVSHVSPAA